MASKNQTYMEEDVGHKTLHDDSKSEEAHVQEVRVRFEENVALIAL